MASNIAVNGPVKDSPHVITASPMGDSAPQEDWDATNKATISRWASIDSGSGVADFSGKVTVGFENGPGRWKQT